MPAPKMNFANMTPERRKEIARLGGIMAHLNGKAHEWNSESAKLAAKKSLESRMRNIAARKLTNRIEANHETNHSTGSSNS